MHFKPLFQMVCKYFSQQETHFCLWQAAWKMTHNHFCFWHRSPSKHINESWQNLEMTWEKLSEVLASIILDIVIDTTVLAMNFQSFSGYLLWGKLISYLNTHLNITCLPAFCIYVGKQDTICHVNHHLGEVCSDFLVFATPETEAFILSSCYSSIYLRTSMFPMFWFQSLLSPFYVSPSSLCRMKTRFFWVSLQSF